MEKTIIFFVIIGCFVLQPAAAVWSCSEDSQCSDLSGGVCRNGDCVCRPGQQVVLGGTLCADLAPYHTSVCREDHQCSRMTVAFQCRREDGQDEGFCSCRPNHHYFLGRCWLSREFGEECTTNEECLGVLRDPYSLTCNNGTCVCSAGYIERQRGECRMVGLAVGDGCVLDSDCQFEDGVCDISSLTCNSNITEVTSNFKQLQPQTVTKMAAVTRQHGVECNAATPCDEPFVCSNLGACVCPVGYYASDNGQLCLAELGSPSLPEQCVGLLAEVRDGICTCPANFFFEDNMRDCVRVTRRLTESCVTDVNCHTFGLAARCGPESPPWGLRTCECIPELSIWDATNQMCRLFAGIGEVCQVDSDCLAGDLEIQCQLDEAGVGYCACPDGYIAAGGLCLTTGLDLGDACQATQECTETANTVCEVGVCACDSSGYREEDGVCAPIIGGACAEDNDCVIENTECTSGVSLNTTCQCRAQFVEHEDECWPTITDLEDTCSISVQCQQVLGEASSCVEGHCECSEGHHFRDGGCWPVTGLFESCSRTSQCYLPDFTERVVCRNSMCQCEFDYPYSEELNTCTSSATQTVAGLFIITIAFILT